MAAPLVSGLAVAVSVMITVGAGVGMFEGAV